MFLTGLADMLRAQLAVVLGSSSVEVSERARATLEERRDRISAGDLLRMLAAIGELEPRFRKSGQQQLLLETLLVRFALLDRTVAIEDVLRGLGDGGSAASGSRRRAVVGGRAPAVPLRQRRRRVRRAAASAQRSLEQRRRRPSGSASMRDQRVARSRRCRLEPSSGPSSRRDAARDRAGAAVARATSQSRRDCRASTSSRERWDDVVAALASSRMLLAPFLEQAVPSAISAAGVAHRFALTTTAAADALEMAKADIAGRREALFPAVERIAIARPKRTVGVRIAPTCDRGGNSRTAHRVASKARSGARRGDRRTRSRAAGLILPASRSALRGRLRLRLRRDASAG